MAKNTVVEYWPQSTIVLALCVLDNKAYKQEQVIGTYVYSQKHNYIPYSTFTITTVQLHVSAINVGHLQVVHEASYDKLYEYLHVSGGYSLWGGCEISFCVCRRGVDRVYLGGVVKISFMSTINYIYRLHF